MTGVVFIIVFGASFVLFPCQGQITSPPDGTRLTFINGSTANITWSFDDKISEVTSRVWYFTSSDGSIVRERLGRIIDDEEVRVQKDSGLSGVTIVKPATLILENVNQTYNGTYRFDFAAPVGGRSEVVVFIAITPNVTVNCSSLITLNASDYFACECKGEGGNPPADVTWFKGEEQKGDTGTEEAILRFTNVNKNDNNGTYTCVGKSHEKAKNVAAIELIVNYPPENVKLMFIRSGKSTTIECSADAHPSPRFKIFVNETKLVKSDKKHTIPEVRSIHVGNYTCVAENILGNKSSGSEYLSPEGPPTPTVARTTTTTSTSNTSTKPTTTNEGTGTVTRTITVNCSSPTTLNKGDEFTCMCRSKYDNPPADVTWYKGNERIVAGKEEAILRFSNVKKEDNGTYKCQAKRHDEAKNEIIELIVNYPPEEVYFKEKAVVGESLTISCETNGHPLPNYTITHNDSLVGGNDKTYTIDVVQYSDAGLYKCTAENKLGTSSKIYQLSVIANTAWHKQDDGTTVVVWHIVVTLVSGIIIGIIFSYIVSCSYRRWFRNKKPERNSEPKTSDVDTTYQELDLSKMNKEDNYQSLRVNSASNNAANDDDSTYTELNKTRDVENNYQSLT